MPLLSVSQIHQVLREDQLERAKQTPKSELTSLLEKHSLTPDDVLENLRSNMISGESGAVRQKAVDTALKLNGLLTPDGVQQDFNITINIVDPEYSGTNPILIPR